jgi:hypothetical protein
MDNNSPRILDTSRALLEDLVKAGTNIRIFNNTPNAGFPGLKDRIIRVVAWTYSDKLGTHYSVEMVPKSPLHGATYFFCPSQGTGGERSMVESFSANQSRCGITLSSGVSYNLYWRRDCLPPEIAKMMGSEGTDYNVGDLFGVNY